MSPGTRQITRSVNICNLDAVVVFPRTNSKAKPVMFVYKIVIRH